MDGLKFCAATYALFESVRTMPGGVERLRLRSGITEKRLLEELLPMCRYIQAYYGPGRYISVRWVNGSQPYDAELHQEGAYVEQGYCPPLAYLEATCAMHENEHLVWRLLHQNRPVYSPEGIRKEKGRPVESRPVVFSNYEHVSRFSPIVVSAIQKKAQIDYPTDTSLVVDCYLNGLYTPGDWQELIRQVESQLLAVPFREVLVVNGATGIATPLALGG